MPALRQLPSSRSSGYAAGNLDELSQNDSRHFAPYDHPIKPAPDYLIKTELISATPSLSSYSGPSAPSSPQSDLEASFQGLSVRPSGDFYAPRTKKNHGRRREAGYVPRPRNSFMVFRSDFVKRNRGAGEDKQNMLSKQAGKYWANMSETEKEPYQEIATSEQRQHKLRYPTYVYTPSPGTRRAARAKTTKKKISGASTASSRAGRAPFSVEEDWSMSVPSSSEQYSPGPESISSHDSLTPRAIPQVAVQRLQQIASSDEIVPSVLDFCQDSLLWDQFSHHQISPMIHYDPLLVEASPPTLDTYTQRFGVEYPLATLTTDQSAYTSEWETNSQFLTFGSTYSLYSTTSQMSDVSLGQEELCMSYVDLSTFPSAS